MFRAQGTTKMYYSEAATNPTAQESLVNFRHYYIVLPKKQEAIGAIYSWDGVTEQSKEQAAPAEKRWAEVRRDAVEAANRAKAAKADAAPGAGEASEEEEVE